MAMCDIKRFVPFFVEIAKQVTSVLDKPQGDGIKIAPTESETSDCF